jgi:hypothetical protein
VLGLRCDALAVDKRPLDIIAVVKVEQVTTIDEAGSVAHALLEKIAWKHPSWPADRAMAYTLSGGFGADRILVISVATRQVDVGDEVDVGGWAFGLTTYVLGRGAPPAHLEAKCEAREWIRRT